MFRTYTLGLALGSVMETGVYTAKVRVQVVVQVLAQAAEGMVEVLKRNISYNKIIFKAP